MKISKVFFALSLFALTVLMNSCLREPSASVDQDKIFTEYELFYNANQDKTYARATFRFSHALGTQLELSEPSKVTFDGKTLTFRPTLAYYEMEMSGLVDQGTFQWADVDGLEFENAIEIHSIQYPETLDTIIRNSSFEIIWQGDGLKKDELVAATLNGENEGDAQIFFARDLGMESIILGKNQLEKLGQGTGTIWLDRSYIPQLQEATGAGGRIVGRYRPVNRTPYFK